MKVSKVKVRTYFDKCVIIDAIADKYVNELSGYPGTDEGLDRLMRNLEKVYKTEKGEIFQAPHVTFEFGGDCDDQTICVAAWCKLYNKEYWYCFLGEKTVTHISQELLVRGKWTLVDCLPYILPPVAKLFTKIRGDMAEWYPQGESLLGPLMEEKDEEGVSRYNRYQQVKTDYVTDQKKQIDDEVARMLREGEIVADQEHEIREEFSRNMSTSLDPVDYGIIMEAQRPAWEAELVEYQKGYDTRNALETAEEARRIAYHEANGTMIGYKPQYKI